MLEYSPSAIWNGLFVDINQQTDIVRFFSRTKQKCHDWGWSLSNNSRLRINLRSLCLNVRKHLLVNMDGTTVWRIIKAAFTLHDFCRSTFRNLCREKLENVGNCCGLCIHLPTIHNIVWECWWNCGGNHCRKSMVEDEGLCAFFDELLYSAGRDHNSSIGFQDVDEKWLALKPAGGKTKRSTHINYTSLRRNTLRTNLAEFSDRYIRFVFPYCPLAWLHVIFGTSTEPHHPQHIDNFSRLIAKQLHNSHTHLMQSVG